MNRIIQLRLEKVNAERGARVEFVRNPKRLRVSAFGTQIVVSVVSAPCCTVIKQIICCRSLIDTPPRCVDASLLVRIVVHCELRRTVRTKAAVMVEAYTRYERPLIAETDGILHVDCLICDLFISVAIPCICRMTRTPLQPCYKRMIPAELPAVLILAALHTRIIFPAEVHGLEISVVAQIARCPRPLLKIIGGRYGIINRIMMGRRAEVIIRICINRPMHNREGQRVARVHAMIEAQGEAVVRIVAARHLMSLSICPLILHMAAAIDARRQLPAERPVRSHVREFIGVCPPRARTQVKLRLGFRCALRNNIDNTTNRIRAVERRTAALHHLDTADILHRRDHTQINAGTPVYNTLIIVETHAIHHDNDTIITVQANVFFTAGTVNDNAVDMLESL